MGLDHDRPPRIQPLRRRNSTTSSGAAPALNASCDWDMTLEKLVLARREAQAGHSERALEWALDALDGVRESQRQVMVAATVQPTLKRHGSMAVLECNQLLIWRHYRPA